MRSFERDIGGFAYLYNEKFQFFLREPEAGPSVP
jgi:hypothetical protein